MIESAIIAKRSCISDISFANMFCIDSPYSFGFLFLQELTTQIVAWHSNKSSVTFSRAFPSMHT